MNKKIILLVVLFMAGFLIKAQQIHPIEYPSGSLSEAKITEILENSRSNGTPEWEIQKANKILHAQLVKQQQATVGGSNNQKTIQPPPVTVGGCNNPNFETGTNTGWTFLDGSNSCCNLPCPTCLTTAGAINVVVSAASTVAGQCTAGIDNYGNFSVVGNGSYSLLLNDASAGFKMQEAQQQFVVSAANSAFTFQYALVLQSGGHPTNEQPYFHVDVLDNTTNAIIPCTEYEINPPSSGNLPGWNISTIDNTVYYHNWVTVTLDLTTYIGSTVTVDFTVSDCNQGAHFGYCYIDASCNPNLITLTKALCAGGGPAILSGPAGFASYSWTGPTTGTTQNLSTSTPGNYTLTTTNSSGCPAPLLYYNLTLNPQPVPDFTVSSAPCSGSEIFTDASTVTTGTIANWQWNFGDGSPVVNSATGANQTHNYNPPGSYVVTLTDSTVQGCKATFTTTINAGGGGPTPAFTTNAPQCLAGNNVVFTNSSTATGSVTITGYNWNYGDGNTGTSTVGAPNSSHVYAATGTFVVTLTVNVTGCSATTTQTVVINNAPTVTVNSATFCAGGTATLTAAGATTYTWSTGATTAAITESPATTTSYTVTGAIGTCTNSAVSTVTIAGVLSITVNSPTVCSGASATLIATGGTTYSWTPDANLSATTGSSVSANPPTTNTYIVTGNTGGCVGTATSIVTIAPNPAAAFNVAAVCQGTGSVFNNTSVSDASCVWNFGGAGNPAAANSICAPTYTYSAPGTFPVSLIVTSVGGCTATATGNAVVNPFPTLGFTVNNTCDQTPITITNTTANQAAIATWSWTFGDAIGTSVVANPGTYTYAGPGVYPVVLTATASTGCSGTVTVNDTIHPNPVADGDIFFTCSGTASTFSSTSFIVNPAGLNDAITTSSWSFGDGSTSPLPSPTHTYATCGSYSVSLTVTTNFNCTDAVGGLDTVYCLPNVTAPPSFSICPGTPVTSVQTAFTTTCALPAIAPAEAVLFVNNNPIFPNSHVTSTHGGIPLADTVDINNLPNYTAIAQNLTCGLLVDTIYGIAITPISATNPGCVGNMQTFTISVYPTPTVTPINDITVCANTAVPAINFTGCPTPETFNWTTTTNPNTVNTGIAATGAGNIGSFTGTNNTSAAAITTLNVTPEANGCIGTPSSFNITVNPVPVLTATGATVCPGAMVTTIVNTIPAAGVTYNWTATNSTNTNMPATGTGTPNAYPAPTNSTLTNQISIVSYTPSLTGCIGLPATDTINIKPTPYMQHIPNQYWCPFQQTNAVTFGTFPPSINSIYNWSYTAGGVPTTSTSAVFPSLSPTSNGGLTTLSTIVTVVPTLNGCIGPDSTFTIFVYPQPQVAFTFNTVCLGSTTSFTTSSPNTGTNAIANWNWNFGDGGNSASANPIHLFLTAGTETVTLIVTTSPNPLPNGGVGCSDTITQNPIVNPNPVANFYGDSVGCPPLNTLFHDNSTPVGSITSWNWSFGNGNTSNLQFPPTQVYPNASAINIQPYPVSYTVTNAAGCIGTKTVSAYIKVYPKPIADFSWEPTDADIDNPVITFVNQAIGANQYTVTNQYGNYGVEYYLDDNLATNTNPNIVYNNSVFTHAYNNIDVADVVETYNVTQWVINQYGCVDSITKPVTILPIFTFYTPNAFSPNGDGKNDGFKGIGEGIDNTTYNMWVFDRWGLMIYYTTDINQVWDGHMRGDDSEPVLQEDVYVWKIKFNDSITHAAHEYHGTVTLLK